MKKVLITGGAGFIGSNLAEELLQKNYSVRIVDNLITGKYDNIASLTNNKNFEFIYGDITNLETCRKVMKGVDMITHQAALGSVPRSIDDPLSSHNNNVNGFLNILLAAKENNIKRIVYASSSSVYGDEKTLPKSEDKVGKVLSPYACTKKINELYSHVFTTCYDMELIGLRYFNIFGPKQDPYGAYSAVIPRFINKMINNESPVINGDGTYSRDFTYISNAINANILSLETSNSKCYGKVFNIGAGGQTTILNLAYFIKKEIGYHGNIILGKNRVGDIPHSNADISLAQNMLGYNPNINFEAGLRKTIKYFLDIKVKNVK